MSWQPILLISLVLWVFGACVGSFLNVVIYRLPAGMSLIRPGSRCPHCGHPIRFHDNVPVLGWLLLSGRCRDCGVAISPRYPLVELAAAILLWLTGMAALEANQFDLRGPWIAQAAYDATLLYSLLGAALMRWDGQRPPLRLFVPAAIVAFALPPVFPFLQFDTFPLFLLRPGETAAGELRWRHLAGQLVGLATGLFYGTLLCRSGRGQRVAQACAPAVVGFALVGLCRGSIAATLAALTVLLVRCTPMRRIRPLSGNVELLLFVSGLLYLLAGSLLPEAVLASIRQQSWCVVLAGLLAVPLAALFPPRARRRG